MRIPGCMARRSAMIFDDISTSFAPLSWIESRTRIPISSPPLGFFPAKGRTRCISPPTVDSSEMRNDVNSGFEVVGLVVIPRGGSRTNCCSFDLVGMKNIVLQGLSASFRLFVDYLRQGI